MNPLLLHIESQEFINSNLNSEIPKLILTGASITGVDTKELIEQIEAKKRCAQKLSTWYHHPNIYYPNKLNIEQTSSELTAKYKASLMTGNNIIDLTGGFGVDSFCFSKTFKSVTHCEINEELSQIVSHNFKQFKIGTIDTIAQDGIEYLKNTDKTYDWIYVDPSRRHDSKGKVFFLEDCLPNIPKALDLLFKHSNNIMIKTSPLLDISIGIGELNDVKQIHVVAINNEVKEVLWILEKGYKFEITVHTINIKKESDETFNFTLPDESKVKADYSPPLAFLYEPNAAILKSGAFNSIANQLDVYKLHKHSHLYTNDVLMEFPGRRFKIENVLPYNKKQLKQQAFKKANITIRNFPETVQQIRNSLKIKDGGTQYLYFTINNVGEKIVLVCSKIK